MATYRITIIDKHLTASDDYDCGDVVAAWKHAMRGALAIAKEEVSHGNPYFAAELVLDEGKKRIGRYVVSVGASPLKN